MVHLTAMLTVKTEHQDTATIFHNSLQRIALALRHDAIGCLLLSVSSHQSWLVIHKVKQRELLSGLFFSIKAISLYVQFVLPKGFDLSVAL